MRKAFDLRPLVFGDVLGRSFSLYTSNFVSYLRWFALFWLFPMLAVAVLFYFALDPYDWATHAHREAPSMVEPNRYSAYHWLVRVAGVLFAVTTGACGVYFISARAYVGGGVGLGELMRAVRERFAHVFGVGFLHYITVVGWTGFCWATPFLLADANNDGAALVAGFFLWLGWLPVLFWYLGVFGLNTVAPMLDDAEALEAYGRSRYLTRRMRWRLVGLMVVAALIVGAPGIPGLLTIPGIIAANLLEGENLPLLGVVVGLCWDAVLLPLFFIPLVVYYFDMRCRKESYDLAVMALNFGIDEGELQRYRFNPDMGYFPKDWKGSRDRGRRRSHVRMPQQRSAQARHAAAGMEVAQPAWGPPPADWGAPQPLPGQWGPPPQQVDQWGRPIPPQQPVDQWGRPLPPPNQPPPQNQWSPPNQPPNQGLSPLQLPNRRGPRR